MRTPLLLTALGGWLALAIPGTAVARPEAGALLRSMPAPSGLASPVGVTFDGAQLWVSDPDAPQIAALDPAQGTMLTTVSLGPQRLLRQLTYDGLRLWALRGSNQVEALMPSGQLLWSIATNNTAGLAYDPNTQLFFELEGGASKVINLRDSAGQISSMISTDTVHTGWSGLAFDGCTLWTSDLDNGLLRRFDPQSGAELASYTSPAVRGEDLAFYSPYTIVLSDSAGQTLHFIEAGSIDVNGVRCVPSLPLSSPPPSVDAGVDAGDPTPPDAGSSPPPDAGEPAQVDAGIVLPDASPEPPDAGTEPSTPPPADLPEPSHEEDDAPPPSSDEGGASGCSATNQNDSASVLALVFLAWFLRRRR